MESKTTIKNKLENDAIERKEKDIVKMWMPYKDKVDTNYKFITNNIFFKMISNILLYLIAIPILYIFDKIVFGYKIKGRENLKEVKGAKITICNHIHILDCTMCAIAVAPTKLFFPTISDNFRIPVVKTLIKLLNAVPIPKGIKAKEKFIDALKKLIENDKTIHFYPEANLIPYDRQIRKFKRGAFKIAVENNIPILPMVFTYREPKGIRKIFNKKPLLTLNILKPIYIEDKEDIDNKIEILRKEMQNMIDNN